ncbi:MAG: monovalent cation:proton antiporter-2 (CPA2) family protein [Gammaproteobacteria bacterium]
MISSYLIDIIVLLMSAVIAVPLFQTVKLGAVPGFLVAGIIVGPYGLGLINNIEEISQLAEIGVVLLLFVIGIELKPSRLWLMRHLVFGLGTLQVLLTGSIISILIHYFMDVPSQSAILIGPALALSSTAFVLQLLTEQKALNSQYGRGSFAILLMQDLAVVPLLALVPLLAMKDLSLGEDVGVAMLESMLILAMVVLGGRYILHPVLNRVANAENSEVFTASAVLIVLGTSVITEHIGLSMAMGAFLAGLLISDSAYRHQVVAEIQPFRGLLLGLFFMSMGMSLNINQFFNDPLYAIKLVTGLMIIKLAVLWPLAHIFGLRYKTGLAVSLVLAQSGEFALVLFALANKSSLLSDDVFQQLLLIVLMSMLLTPALARMAHQLVANQNILKSAHVVEPVAAPIVIAGFGRVGHRIGEILHIVKQPYVALDLDANLVDHERDRGHSVFYGDVRKPEVLKAAGAENARLVIITLNDTEATERLVISLRKSNPQLKIFVRGHSLQQCQILRKVGASVAVSENVEASLELAKAALNTVGIDETERDFILAEFRNTYYSQIDQLGDIGKTR